MIRFSIIGLGNIGRRHMQHILANPDAELVSICDIDEGRLIDLPEGVKIYTDEEEFFNENQSDVINVCTPNYLHLKHSVKGIKSGSHVVVEKPLALSTQECDEMISASVQFDKKIFAVKQNRYNPPVQIVKDLIDNGKLGIPYFAQVNCFWNRNDQYYSSGNWRGKKQLDGGCLYTQFSHFIDILYYLIGDVKPISGLLKNFHHTHNTELEDTGSFILNGENECIVNFNFTTNAYEKNMEGSITVMGERGIVKIGGQYLNTLEYSVVENEILPNLNIQAKENDYGTYKGSMSNHDKIIQNVIDVLKLGKPMMTTVEEGREVVRIIENMYEVAVVK